MRKCSDCYECCVVGYVPEIEKAPHTPCPLIKVCKSGSCSIFDKPELPKTCKTYNCAWINGFGNQNDRPKDNRVMFTSNILEGQKFLTAIELEKNAIVTTGSAMAIQMVTETKVPMIVVKYGKKPPEDTGDFVIIHEDILSRCTQIAANTLHIFNDKVAMYELIKGK